MLRCNGVASVIRCTLENLSKPNTCAGPLGVNNLLENCSSNSNITSRTCGVNLIQARHRHVMDDAMEEHRTFKYGLKTGVKVGSEIVTKKFFRLRWGMWIRTVGGKDKEVWKKDSNKQRFHKQHVFCQAKFSHLLDRMVTKEYKRPHHYVDDPYDSYHSREEFMYSRKKPLPPSKNVYQYIDE